MAKRIVTAKVFRVNRAPSIEKIDASLEGLQAIVGGYIEGIHLAPNRVNHHILYCNEDGRAKKLPPNLRLPNGVVVLGNAVMVLHNSDGDAIPLTEYEPEAICGATFHLAEDGSEIKHTPMPWKARGRFVEREGKKVAICCGGGLGEGWEQEKADAAFIVHAVNNHERLQKVASALLAAYHAPTKLRDGEEQTMRGRLVDEVYELVAAIAQDEVQTEKEPYEKPAIRAGTPKETE